MRTETKGHTVVIFQEKSDPKGKDFRTIFKSHYKNYNNKNIVLVLLELSYVGSKDIKEFRELASFHKQTAQKSFVFVTGPLSLKYLPEDLVTVPTLDEAFDAIEIEEIERDLGYL
jgi:hypothetical protein